MAADSIQYGNDIDCRLAAMDRGRACVAGDRRERLLIRHPELTFNIVMGLPVHYNPGMEITFEPAVKWDGDRGGVLFWATADGNAIRCFVSRRAVHDTCGGTGAKEDVLEKFDESRSTFELEAAALIRSARAVPVEGQSFREAQILSGRIRHRANIAPTRRVTADELLGAGVAKYATDADWWSQASKQPRGNIQIASSADRFLQVDILFESEDAAREFDYRMSQFGVRTFRLAPAG